MLNQSDVRATATLEDWYPDTVYQVLWGNIKADSKKRWADGTKIHTSYVPNVDPKTLKEGDLVVTLNSVYLLGKKKEKINVEPNG